MTTQATTDFGRELLAQREWLLRLASTLVSDPSLAEDLVQETWLAALRTRPAAEGGLRAWLATVLRNRANTRLRDQSRRLWRERLASRAEASASTGDVVERAALQQEVVSAVMALEEPFRETVLLRFFDELPPRTIAERMHVPVSTVKSRLARGMEKLRDRLDASHGGDRRAWLAGVFAWIEVEQGSWVGKGLLAAGVLVLGGGATWVALESRRAAPPAGEVSKLGEMIELPSVSQRTELEGFRSAGETRDESEGVSQARSKVDRGEAVRRRLEALGYIGERKRKDELEKIVTVPLGLARVRGGVTTIGEGSEELREVLATAELGDDFEIHDFADLAPHYMDVDDFLLMQTEVTGEQYLEYVLSSGARPPLAWARKLPREHRPSRKDGGGSQSFSVVGEVNIERDEWWQENWREVGWELPKELATRPVVGLDFREALAYARWAGLRLPTEAEFARALRGEGDDPFPWGREWKSEAAATLEARRQPGLGEVGDRRADRAQSKFCDLVGNAAEWTSSPFDDYLVQPTESLDVLLASPRPRVVRGGSVAASWALARSSSREAVAPGCRGDALGFRCASSVRPCEEGARWAEAEVSRAGLRLSSYQPTRYSIEELVGIERWRVRRRKSKVRVGGYNVVRAYEHVIFIPVRDLPARVVGGPFESSTWGEPTLIGLLSTRLPMLEPALPPGTYRILLAPQPQAAGRSVLYIDDRGEIAGVGVAAVKIATTADYFEARRLFSRGEFSAGVLDMPLEHGTLLSLRFSEEALAGDWSRRR